MKQDVSKNLENKKKQDIILVLEKHNSESAA